MPANIQRGHSHPLGATLRGDGANFSVYALGAERVELLLFDRPSDERPARVISLDADNHHTFRYWHAHVGGVAAGQAYGYRVFGPHTDAGKVLLDPYARAVDVARWDRAAASRGGDNCATAPRGVLVDPHDYDWEGDRPLQRPIQQTVIYELHVRGFTVHPSSGVSTPNRGTFSGLVEKIPYLVDLGITAVELMPVMQFDAQEAPKGRTNYWGYCPMSWFAPHSGYASRPGATAVLDEFRAMVKAFHRAGIEVILDVVYNHTAEGGRRGPTFSWRGLADDTYYLHDHDGGYADFTGTGNTIKADHPVTRRMLFDSLVYWVEEMHVDGFRFDLASVLARDATGEPLPDPQLIRAIESHPVLAGTKMIAEAWDAAGLFQVGSFAGDRWHEWNAHYRDDLRRYLRGDPGSARSFVARLLGSPDIYGHEEREPEQSINFVTCHDGFPLADVVAYSRKHNLDNGEQDRDGLDENFSWNCGVEGSTDDLEIDLRRLRHGKSLLALLLLSLGTPMLSMGDELRRTQRGNNNA
ncbi:MAG: glycogen-debranching protein, partial [Planctomycetes bacterium]|nr:glycogen-debranching protein [Planctomycetota bacterium]